MAPIVALSAAVAAAVAACSDDGASTMMTTEVATTTAASNGTELAADGSIADQVDIGGGRTISVDGRELFLECRGTGSPTMILQSGFGNAG